jgi:LysM repeat protein
MYFRDVNKDTYFDYYTISSGDNLYKISKQYNINPSLLASLNGLDSSDYIYPGQVLLIPNKNYSYYITKSGDTLDGVASTFNVSSNKLINDNKTIYVLEGQMIVNKKD